MLSNLLCVAAPFFFPASLRHLPCVVFPSLFDARLLLGEKKDAQGVASFFLRATFSTSLGGETL